MSNYYLNIQYDGTDFNGWQSQPGQRTIQNEIEKIFNKIFDNQKIKIIGSGRTDSGVHAYEQVANVFIETDIDDIKIKKAINRYLPNDIFINDCRIVNDNFNARFSAKKREYIYYISNNYSSIKRAYRWHYKYEYDVSVLNKCVDFLLGEHDFSLLSKASSETKNKICNIYTAEWSSVNNKIMFKISANRFLQHMVRFIVGTMMEVSRGQISLKEFEKIILRNNPKHVAFRAPAQGLFLNKIYYE